MHVHQRPVHGRGRRAGHGSELRVLLLDRADHVLEALGLGQALTEGRVPEEAGDPRERLQVLAAGVLRHDEQEEVVRRLSVDRLEVDALRGCARRSPAADPGPPSCRAGSRRLRRCRCSGAPRARAAPRAGGSRRSAARPWPARAAISASTSRLLRDAEIEDHGVLHEDVHDLHRNGPRRARKASRPGAASSTTGCSWPRGTWSRSGGRCRCSRP